MHSLRITRPPTAPWVLVTLSLLTSCKQAQKAAQKETAPAIASPANPIPTSKNSPHVKAALIPLDSDDDGHWDLLAVDWTLGPGWHIYWTNPGDSGLATQVTFDTASSKALDPVRLPAPRQFYSAGDIIGYGYHDHTTFFAKRRDPKRQLNTPIQAKLRWLVCKDTCLRGSATLGLAPLVAPKAWTPEQRKAYARLPKAATELEGKISWSDAPEGGKTATLELPSGELVEFFPLDSKAKLRASALEAGHLRLTYQDPAALATTGSALGLVGAKTKGATTYYEVKLPAPQPDTIAP